MKHKYMFLVLVSSLSFGNTTIYDGFFPPYLGSGNITAKTNCSYAENQQDCYFGYDRSGLRQHNVEHRYGTSNIVGKLGSEDKNNKNMDIYFNNFKINNGRVNVTKFHTMLISGGLNISDNSNLSIDMEPKYLPTDGSAAASPEYGDIPKFIFFDFLYGEANNNVRHRSTLKIEGGNLVIGKTKITIDETSAIEVIKKNQIGGEICNRGHIINYGKIETEKLYNGFNANSNCIEGVTTGISSQNVSGRIDNYGVISGEVLITESSTFVFHSMNGKMGSIVNQNFTNACSSNQQCNTKLIVDIAGASYGQHTLLAQGSLDTASMRYSNASEDFITASVDGTSKEKIDIGLKQNIVRAFEETFKDSKKDILNALNKRYNIYSRGGREFVLKSVDDVTRGVLSNYVTTPLSLIDTLKPSLVAYNSGVNAGLIGAGFFGDDIGIGGMGGIQVNISIPSNNNIFQTQLGYGYGSLKNNSGISDSAVNANLIMLSLMDLISINNIEVYLGGHLSIGFLKTTQYLAFDKITYDYSTANAKFNLYSLNLDSNVGYRFKFSNYSIKPFIGLNQEVYVQGKFYESGGLKINSNGNTSYIPYALLGFENRYELTNKNALFAKMYYEHMILDTKFIVFSNQEKVALTSPYASRLGLELGGDIAVNNNMFIYLGGFYKTNIGSIHYLGGNAAFRYLY